MAMNHKITKSISIRRNFRSKLVANSIMLSRDPHDKFSAINTRRLSRWLVSGSYLSVQLILKFLP